jgi:hypothetical protein
MSDRATIISACIASYLVASPCIGIALVIVSVFARFPHDEFLVAVLMLPPLIIGLLACAGLFIFHILEQAGIVK